MLLVVTARLIQLQGIGADHYALAASAERLRHTVLHGARGSIVDRNGVVLAYTADAKDVVADPAQINCTAPADVSSCQVSDRLAYGRAMAPMLGEPAGSIAAALAVPGQYALIGKAITPSAASQIDALNLRGIYIEPTTQRLYPGTTTAGNVVGLVNADGEGVAGVEQQFDPVLRGKDGQYTYELTSTGSVNPAGATRRIPAVDGGVVHLTLSQDLQFWVQHKLTAAVKQTQARSGQAVVLDLKGNVLAMASTSTFDPQDPSTIDAKLSMNPSVQQVFEPGSVNKVVTFTAALEHKVITPLTRLNVPDYIQMGGVTVHDAWWHPVQRFTATGVLAESSNVGTLKIAQRVGPKMFDHYLKAYGLGTATGIEVPGESAGLLPAMNKWSGSTFANLPIGQGVAMTALQMTSMYQSIANGGVRIPPRIVSSVTNPDGTVTVSKPPAGIRVTSPATAKTLTTMLESVMLEGGTGVKAAVPGYRFAGKTGTAQQPDEKTGVYSAVDNWDTFAGFAPADAPRFVIGIMVDKPNHNLHAADVTAPLAHAIAAYELQHERVAPTGSVSKRVPLIVP